MLYKMVGFCRQKEFGTKKLGVDCFRQGHLPLGKSRVYQVYYLTNADQEIPDCLFKIPFLGEAEIKLS